MGFILMKVREKMSIYDVVYSSPNFGYPRGSFERRGHNIIGIGLHITGGSWQSSYSWIMNPAANASYNAIVKDDGSVVSLVPEKGAAYAHGRINRPSWPLLKKGVNPNLYTLSLARTGTNQNSWTGDQLKATLKVLKYWSDKYNIPLERPYVFGHFEIDSVGRLFCPGHRFFERVIKALEEGEHLATDEAADAQTESIWHRVIAGSYRVRANAEQQVERLRISGIDAFVMPHRDD